MAAAAKKYVATRPFERTDPRTGTSTHYAPGDPYEGPDTELYLAWPDDFGPLVREASEDRS